MSDYDIPTVSVPTMHDTLSFVLNSNRIAYRRVSRTSVVKYEIVIPNAKCLANALLGSKELLLDFYTRSHRLLPMHSHNALFSNPIMK